MEPKAPESREKKLSEGTSFEEKFHKQSSLDLEHLARDTFQKTSDYLQGLLEGTGDHYKVLEEMNTTTTQRYGDMKQVTQNISHGLQELNEKYHNLRPYLDQIDEIDRSSKRLEEAAYALDGYSKALEAKYKELEKRGMP